VVRDANGASVTVSPDNAFGRQPIHTLEQIRIGRNGP
jgi:hypothetical protein